MTLQEWVDDKYREISRKLPLLSNTQPDSFICGHTTGYKACLLELDKFLEESEYYQNELRK